MPSGGARARSGPAPDPNALRRAHDQGEWVSLPADGGFAAPPEWPLPDVAVREVELWGRLWARPQALMWARNQQELEVALYVRRFAEAEVSGARSDVSTLVRQMQDALGLSVPGLRANRWRIVPVEAAVPVTPARVSAGSRDRFRVVGEGA